MPVLFSNNASTTLASGIAAGATSLTVATGQGALFPTITGSNFFYVTLANTSNVLEIVKVTARTGDTMTIVRGQDGTTATAYNTGDKVELRPTAAGLAWKVDQDFTGTLSGNLTLSGTATFSSTTTLNGTVAGTGFIAALATLPGPVGTSGTAQNLRGATITATTGFSGGTGSFTTLAASSTVSGTGFTNYFAAPPQIGITTPNGAKFTFAATAPVAVTFSATAMTVDCSLSNVFTTTFTANVTTAPTLSNAPDGQTINWFITQDATGSRTMTWPTSFKWPNGTAGVLSTAANAVDLVVATYRSATGFWYATLSKGFA
jgi:hypothetical protein